MFRSAVQRLIVAVAGGARTRDHSAGPQPLSLDARLGLYRRRRRVALLKRMAPMAPVLMGMSFFLIVAFGGMPGTR
jgi:hypothetical protein